MKNLFLLNFLILGSIFAQEKNFDIITSLDTVLLGNYLEVKFIVRNIDGKFTEPNFTGLKLISGPNTMRSTSIVNSDVSSISTYSYIIKPSEIGEYIIESAKIETEDGVLKTKEKKIVVVANPKNIIQTPNTEEDPFNNIFIEQKPNNNKPKKKTFRL